MKTLARYVALSVLALSMGLFVPRGAQALVIGAFSAEAGSDSGTSAEFGPGAIASSEYDHSNNGSHIVEQAIAVGIGPSALVSAEGLSTRLGGSVEVSPGEGFGPILHADAGYSVAIIQNSNLNVVVPDVPIVFGARVLAQATVSGAVTGNFGVADAEVGTDIPTQPNNPSATPIDVMAREFCIFDNELQLQCLNVNPGTTQFSGFAQPGALYIVGIHADGGGFVFGEGSTFNIDSVADPLITISDALIPGTSLRYSDVFTVEVSPGVVQGIGGSNVPESSTSGLLALGLLGIAATRKRTLSTPARPNYQ